MEEDAGGRFNHFALTPEHAHPFQRVLSRTIQKLFGQNVVLFFPSDRFELPDWLNDQGIKPGPAARTPRWTCSLVTQLLHNPILKGVRLRNKKMSKRFNQTGRHKSRMVAASGTRVIR